MKRRRYFLKLRSDHGQMNRSKGPGCQDEWPVRCGSRLATAIEQEIGHGGGEAARILPVEEVAEPGEND